MKHSHSGGPTFRERLAYLRWLKHLVVGEPPTKEAIGEAVNRSGAWVSKWEDSPTAPKDYTVHAPLAAYFDVGRDWLIEGVGEAPDPDLWTRWRLARGIKPTAEVGGDSIRSLGEREKLKEPATNPKKKKESSA